MRAVGTWLRSRGPESGPVRSERSYYLAPEPRVFNEKGIGKRLMGLKRPKKKGGARTELPSRFCKLRDQCGCWQWPRTWSERRGFDTYGGNWRRTGRDQVLKKSRIPRVWSLVFIRIGRMALSLSIIWFSTQQFLPAPTSLIRTLCYTENNQNALKSSILDGFLSYVAYKPRGHALRESCPTLKASS